MSSITYGQWIIIEKIKIICTAAWNSTTPIITMEENNEEEIGYIGLDSRLCIESDTNTAEGPLSVILTLLLADVAFDAIIDDEDRPKIESFISGMDINQHSIAYVNMVIDYLMLLSYRLSLTRQVF